MVLKYAILNKIWEKNPDIEVTGIVALGKVLDNPDGATIIVARKGD